MLRFACLLSAVALVAAPAAAQPASDDRAPAALVRYDDLNLATPAGRDALSDRVRTAARQLCIDPEARDLGVKMLRTACYKSALAAAHDQVVAAVATFGRLKLASRQPLPNHASH